MTAVASPPSFQPLSRDGYVNGSLNTMSQEDISRSFLPRKSVQRTGSSSSLSSNASSVSTVSSTATQVNGVPNGDGGAATNRKKPSRVWPATKSEPVLGMSSSGASITRSQSVPPSPVSAVNGTAALSSLAPSPLPPQQPMAQIHTQTNGVTRPEATAILHLTPMNGTFERKTITVPYHPDIIRIGRQTNPKTVPTPTNGYFDSKVLSRQHAEIWADREGKIWIRDVKSSNGTFVNQRRLSAENKDSEPCMLKEQDILELGIDIVSEDQKSVVHHKVAARVEHAGVYPLTSNALDINFGDLDQAAGGAGIGQQIVNNVRGRSPNQSINPAQRFSNPNLAMQGNMVSSAYHAKWLQPITMEQVVKKLNTELKQARLQSQDLNHTGSYVDALLNREVPPPPPPPQTSTTSSLARKQSSPTKLLDIKARFASEPPAPPPSQPLPEKPDVASRVNLPDFPNLQPLLRRSETEKPKVPSETNSNSPIKSDPSHQILNLIEALTRAQNEIDSQSDRIKQMEALLQSEREARTSAEERAVRLESSTNQTPAQGSGAASQGEERITWTMQSRFEMMQDEMSEMKQHMEEYRIRAEDAEEESKKSRKSLEEMVESITRRSIAARERKAAKRAARMAANEKTDGANDEKKKHASSEGAIIEDDYEDDDALDLDGLSEDLNGHVDAAIIQKLKRSSTIRPTDYNPALAEARLKQLTGAISSLQGNGQGLRQDHLVNTAPLASILGVVLLGVGMMAYLNGWQKVSER